MVLLTCTDKTGRHKRLHASTKQQLKLRFYHRRSQFTFEEWRGIRCTLVFSELEARRLARGKPL